MSLDTVWLRENIITIIDLRNIVEVFSVNILDRPTAPTPSPLPLQVNSYKEQWHHQYLTWTNDSRRECLPWFPSTTGVTNVSSAEDRAFFTKEGHAHGRKKKVQKSS